MTRNTDRIQLTAVLFTGISTALVHGGLFAFAMNLIIGGTH
jgi:hypothetical protein